MTYRVSAALKVILYSVLHTSMGLIQHKTTLYPFLISLDFSLRSLFGVSRGPMVTKSGGISAIKIRLLCCAKDKLENMDVSLNFQTRHRWAMIFTRLL